jgi:hypothetical protein
MQNKETSFKKWLVRELKIEWFSFLEFGMGASVGCPDIVCKMPNSQGLVFIETKHGANGLRPSQREWQRKAKLCGVKVTNIRGIKKTTVDGKKVWDYEII